MSAKGRLGFISVSGAVIAGAVLLVVLAVTLVAGPLLFTAGPLNAVAKTQPLGGVASHAQITSCEGCHTPFWSGTSMAATCMDCHTDVRDQVAGRSGLHGHLVGGASSPTCRGCHTEHHGPAGLLTVTDATFPHELTGYSLAGHRSSAKGSQVTCASCHPKGLSTFAESTCADCHQGIDAAFMTQHEASFGASCLACHDGSGRFGFDFDHNKLPFKLVGKHVGLACTACHPGSQSGQGFKSAPQDCYGCHAKSDKHNGTFGRQCGQCHSPSGWAGASFDHSVFPVNHGSNEQVATCQTCHPNDVSTYTCFGCHRHTPANVQNDHEGRTAAELADCIRCHAGGRRGDN